MENKAFKHVKCEKNHRSSSAKSTGNLETSSWYLDERRKRDEFLEKLINTTTLTTKQVTHYDIEDIGSDVHRTNTRNSQRRQQVAVEEAVNSAVTKCKTEYQHMLQAQLDKSERSKEKALEEMEKIHEKQAEETRVNRDLQEQEAFYVLKCKLLQEKEEELTQQLEDCQKKKEKAIELALSLLYKKLSASSSTLFEQTLEKALYTKCEENEREKEQAVKYERDQCKKDFDQQMKAERHLHEHEIMTLRERLAIISADKLRPQVSNLQSSHNQTPLFTVRVNSDAGDVINNEDAQHNRRVTSLQTNLIFLGQKSCGLQTEL